MYLYILINCLILTFNEITDMVVFRAIRLSGKEVVLLCPLLVLFCLLVYLFSFPSLPLDYLNIFLSTAETSAWIGI